MKHTPPPLVHGIDRMLHRLSSHLDGLAAEVYEVESAIGEGLGHPAIRPADAPTPITQLQSLDYLRQSLEDLSLLTLSLSRAVHLGGITAAETDQTARKLRLAVTRQLLLSEDSPEVFGADHRDAGELDLF